MTVLDESATGTSSQGGRKELAGDVGDVNSVGLKIVIPSGVLLLV